MTFFHRARRRMILLLFCLINLVCSQEVLLEGMIAQQNVFYKNGNGQLVMNGVIYEGMPGAFYQFTNVNFIPDMWHVWEISLYTTIDCRNAIGANEASWKDSAVDTYERYRVGKHGYIDVKVASILAGSDMGSNRESNIVDGYSTTGYYSNCRLLLGGCPPFSQWIMMNLTNPMVENAKEFALQPKLVEPFPEDGDIAKCFRILQGESPLRIAREIKIDRWNGVKFDHHITLDALGGGLWDVHPRQTYEIWKVQVSADTERDWYVSDLKMYIDVLCTEVVQDFDPRFGYDEGFGEFHNPPLHGVNGNVDPKQAFDEEPGVTGFRAPCGDGCKSNSTWVGLKLMEPQWIRCFSIRQPEKDSFSTRLSLINYETGVPYVTAGTWHVDSLQWNSFPAGGTFWRIVNDALVMTKWVIDDLELYPRVTQSQLKMLGLAELPDYASPCLGTGRLDYGNPEAVPPLEASTPLFAFDGDESTSWTAPCPPPCGRGKAWVGMMYDDVVDVQCIRLLQPGDYRAGDVRLDRWTGSGFETAQTFKGLAGDTWNNRPMYSGSMFRVINTLVPEEGWYVNEIRAYTDSSCKENVPEGEVISSGSRDIFRRAAYAFDGTLTDGWFACEFGCMAVLEAWVGMSFDLAEMKEEHLTAAQAGNIVRCAIIHQDERPERQSDARVEWWAGDVWREVFEISGIGGGSWQRRPAMANTLWRLKGYEYADPEFRRLQDGTPKLLIPKTTDWVVHDVFFYADAECLKPLLIYQGVAPIASSNAEFSEPYFALDNNYETVWKVGKAGVRGAWIGVDLGDAPVDVQCVRVAQDHQEALQVPEAAVEKWDGREWVPTPIVLEDLGGGSGERRPAEYKSLWRLEARELDFGWRVYEVQMYEHPFCGGSHFLGSMIASSHVEGHNAFRAGDGDPRSDWFATCPDDGNPETTDDRCERYDTWIGVDTYKTKEILCFKLWQTGLHQEMARDVRLSYWDGVKWIGGSLHGGLGGNTWHQRPQGPNRMWRLGVQELSDDQCEGFATRNTYRPWGVKDLEFYSDDGCSKRILGRVIASGRRTERWRTETDIMPKYDMKHAFDRRPNTIWAANCGVRPEDSGAMAANCHHDTDWIGLETSSEVYVRCFKIKQAFDDRGECCDRANIVHLERWNGTAWAEAAYAHQNSSKESVHRNTQFTKKHIEMSRPIRIGANFTNLGDCPFCSDNEDLEACHDASYWEVRERRLSEECMIPVSAAAKLMGDTNCVSHDRCAGEMQGAGFFEGKCCPAIEEGTDVRARCCCSYIVENKLFNDEISLTDKHTITGSVELAIITISRFAPWVGMSCSIMLLILLYFPKYTDDDNGFERFRERVRHYIETSGLMPVAVVRELSIFDDTTALFQIYFRSICLIVLGFIVTGTGMWLFIGHLIAKAGMWLITFLALPVRWCKNPFGWSDDQVYAREKLTGKTVRAPSKFVPIGFGAVLVSGGMAAAVGLVLFAKVIIDMVVMREVFLNMEITSQKLKFVELLDNLPGLFDPVVELLNDAKGAVAWSNTVYANSFSAVIGMPKCGGPALIFCSVCLFAITAMAARWLNYDMFGIFYAGKHAANLARPPCQNAMLQAMLIGSQVMFFAIVQAMMLIFNRSIAMAFPWSEQNWVCPVDDSMSMFIGRCLTGVLAFGGLITFWLCVNGHFLGQDYISVPLATILRWDLAKLDPDGDGFVRLSTHFSVLPTIFGIWTDRWNVDGYLVKDRAHVYAENLNMERHAEYEKMMRATGLQMGLALQLFPLGVVLGKCAEYLNYPRLFYHGLILNDEVDYDCPYIIRKREKWIKVKWHPVFNKHFGENVMNQLHYFTSICLRYIIPTFQRLLTIALYVFAVMGVFLLNEDNVRRDGKDFLEIVLLLAGV